MAAVERLFHRRQQTSWLLPPAPTTVWYCYHAAELSLEVATPTGFGLAIGYEYQILDDARNPDAKLGRDGNRTLGSLYDLIPAATSKQPKAIGQWNTTRILLKGRHVEHWLNGAKILEYWRGTPEFRARVAASKFNVIPDFGSWPDGHILLQEDGGEVSFRNLKIRTPSPNRTVLSVQPTREARREPPEQPKR